MSQINIDYLSEYLFNKSIHENAKISFEEAEQFCLPMIEVLGVTQEERELITQYALAIGHHCIDGQSMMVALGIMASGQYADKAKRTLERCNLIPKGLKFEAPPSGGGSRTHSIHESQLYDC